MSKIQASIIVPAYNESTRITPFLQSLIKFHQKNLKNCEILIVDDGSQDNTLNIVRNLIKGKKNCKILSYKKNRGKGYAVRKGFMHSNGEKLIFIDADGSITPDEIPKMIKHLDSYQIVAGSRAHKSSIVNNVKTRKFIGNVFNSYVRLLFNIKVHDNLCGFKGFQRNIGQKLFQNLHAKRWIFDVEIFYRAKKNRYSLKFIPINWTHKPNTKISIFDPLKMAMRLLKLRIKLL